MIRFLFVLCALASFSLGADASVANEELEAAYDEIVEDVVKDLHGFASWCSSTKLYLERDKAFESVLFFEPNNFKAHKGLKHRRERDGSWTVPEDREPSKNYKLSKLGKCAERRAKLVAAFREEVAALYAKYEEDVTRQHQERVHEAVLRIEPDHAEVRALRGEVRLEETWVLEETRASRLARADWDEFLPACAKEVPATERVTETDWEAGLGIRWTTALRTPHLRVLSMVDRAETSLIVSLDHVARAWIDTLAPLEPSAWPSYSVYVVPDRVSKGAFVAAHSELKDIPAAELDRRGSRIGGAGDMVRWDRMKLERLESLAHHAALRAIEVRLRGAAKEAWLAEGLAAYVSRRLIDTHATGFKSVPSKRTGDAQKRSGDAQEIAPAWVRAALANYAAEAPRTLARVLTLRKVEMQPEDHVVSLAFSAFLLEGHAGEMAQLATRLERGEAADEALAAWTGRSLEELESRLRRWLAERD